MTTQAGLLTLGGKRGWLAGLPGPVPSPVARVVVLDPHRWRRHRYRLQLRGQHRICTGFPFHPGRL